MRRRPRSNSKITAFFHDSTPATPSKHPKVVHGPNYILCGGKKYPVKRYDPPKASDVLGKTVEKPMRDIRSRGRSR